MQDWDRIVMILLGLAASLPSALEGRRLWLQQKYGAVTGLVLLILSALGLPILLVLFAT